MPDYALMSMTYDEWLRFRDDRFRAYPPQLPHLCLDIELSHPRQRLVDIPVEFNPHQSHGSRDLFYACDDWTARTDPVLIEPSPHGRPTWRMIVESSHKDDRPKLLLMSTSSSIVHEGWAAKKNWNDFARYDNMLWRVTWNEYFGEWPGGKIKGLPFHDRRPVLAGHELCLASDFHSQFVRKRRVIRRLLD